MVKYLFDTNIVFSFFFTTGEEYITPLIESNEGQLIILKDSYPELQNLVQRSFWFSRIMESNEFVVIFEQ